MPDTIPPRAQVDHPYSVYPHPPFALPHHPFCIQILYFCVCFLVQVQCPLVVMNLRASRDVGALDFSYKFEATLVLLEPSFSNATFRLFSPRGKISSQIALGFIQVNVKLRLPAVLNKFLQPIQMTAEEFFQQWRALAGPPLKLQEVVSPAFPSCENRYKNIYIRWKNAYLLDIYVEY